MRTAMCSMLIIAGSAAAADPLDFSAFDKRLTSLEKRVDALERARSATATTQRVQVCDGQTCRWVDVPSAGASCGCPACPAGTCSAPGACGQAGCGFPAQTVASPVYGWPASAAYSAPQMFGSGGGSCANGQCSAPSSGRVGLFGRRR
jgi:hypothetical protein